MPLGYLPSLASLANLTRTRGTNNASDINLASLFPDEGLIPIDVALGVLASGSSASMDTPPWWNMGHRPVKFVDGRANRPFRRIYDSSRRSAKNRSVGN